MVVIYSTASRVWFDADLQVPEYPIGLSPPRDHGTVHGSVMSLVTGLARQEHPARAVATHVAGEIPGTEALEGFTE